MNTPNTRLWNFVGGSQGEFRISRVSAIKGEGLPATPRLSVFQSPSVPSEGSRFWLRGVVSNERYVTRPEKTELTAHQQGIGRAESTLGALIPIKKSRAWWDLPQDERRAIFEERSRHVQIGHQALPGVARRLHHCRDLETDEPFDFLTWFDFAPATESAFDDLLGALRSTEEWQYVEREVELRVAR